MMKFHKQDIENVVFRVKRHVPNIFSFKIPTKIISELLSALFIEEMFSYYKQKGRDVKKETNDNDPDLTFMGVPLEIKVTKCPENVNGLNWRGGTYSKRTGQYLLISWKVTNSKVDFFISTCYIHESEWKMPELSQVTQAQNYYATTFSIKDLYEKDRIDLVGSLDKIPKDKMQINFVDIFNETESAGEILFDDEIVFDDCHRTKNDEIATKFFDF